MLGWARRASWGGEGGCLIGRVVIRKSDSTCCVALLERFAVLIQRWKSSRRGRRESVACSVLVEKAILSLVGRMSVCVATCRRAPDCSRDSILISTLTPGSFPELDKFGRLRQMLDRHNPSSSLEVAGGRSVGPGMWPVLIRHSSTSPSLPKTFLKISIRERLIRDRLRHPH